MLFPERIEIPCTTGTETQTSIGAKPQGRSSKTDVAEFASCGHQCRLSMEAATLRVEIWPDKEPNVHHMETRIVEGLQFVLARPMSWVLFEREGGRMERTEVRSVPMPASTRRILPPIHFTRITNAESVWRLCDHYLRHVASHPDEKWHPLSQRLHSVLEATAGSVEVHARTLGIEIEGILKSEFVTSGVPDDIIHSQIDQARELIAGSRLDEGFKERMFGSLRSMRSPRADDRLRALVEAGAITDDQRSAWKKLRNSSTHADRADFLPQQEFVDRLMRTTVLLYHLVFAAIGYHGPYTDYGSRGWPTRPYEGPNAADS